jgi:hypothetical protein
VDIEISDFKKKQNEKATTGAVIIYIFNIILGICETIILEQHVRQHPSFNLICPGAC